MTTKIDIKDIHDLEDKTIVKLIKYVNENILNPQKKLFIKKTQETLTIEELVERIERKHSAVYHYLHALLDYMKTIPKQYEAAAEECIFIFHRILVLVQQKEYDQKKDLELKEYEIKLLKDKVTMYEEELNYFKNVLVNNLGVSIIGKRKYSHQRLEQKEEEEQEEENVLEGNQ